MELNPLPLSQIPLEDVMETQPLMVESETFLIDVAALMSQPREREGKSGTGGEKGRHYSEKATGLSSCAIVLEEGELVGLLTAKDLIRWVAWHQNLAEIQVGEVIDRRKVTLKQSEFRDFFSLLKTMGQEGITHLPIVNDLGEVLGVVTPRSLNRGLPSTAVLALGRGSELAVEVKKAGATAFLLEVVRLMALDQVTCVGIVEGNSNESEFLGTITARDIVKIIAEERSWQTIPAIKAMGQLGQIDRQDSLAKAYKQMLGDGVEHLAVTDGSRFVGTITQTSVLKALDNCQLANTIHLLEQEVKRLQAENAAANRRQERELAATREQLQREIYRHQETETALQRAKEQLEAVLDAVPATISWISSDLHYLGVNKQLANLVQLPPESFIGRPVGELNSHQEFLQYIAQFFASSLEQDKTEFNLKGSNADVTYFVAAKKYHQGSAAVLVGIDISERRQAEEAVIKSAAMNEALLNAIPDSMFCFTRQGEWINYIPAKEKELYFAPQQLIGKKVDEVLPPPVAGSIRRCIAQAFASGQLQETEYRLPQENGTMADWEARFAVSGENEVVAIVRNITERKQAELALRRSEARFRAIFEQAAVGMVEAGLDGQFLQLNQKFCDLLGYKEEELLRKTFLDITHPEDVGELRRDLDKILGGKITDFDREQRCLAQEGHIVWVNLTISHIGKLNGEPPLLSAIVEDIDDRKKAEMALHQSQEFLSNVINTNPNLIFVKDWQGKFVLANQAVANVYGTTIENLLGKTEVELNGNNSENKQFITDERQVIASLRSQFMPEETLTTPSGEVRYFQTIKKPLLAKAGHCQVLGVATDITDRKRAEEKIQKALEKEKELSELKSRFVSMTSHEFRTPLTTILGSAELLKHYSHNWTEEKKQKYLNRIYNTVKDMTLMLEDILSIGQGESGRLEFNPEPLNLTEFCRGLVEELQIATPNHERIIFQVTSQVKVLNGLMFDEKLLRQILSNLLSNALKYSEDDTKIDFNLNWDNEGAIFLVRDRGIGIPQFDLEHLFKSFHRGQNVGLIPGTGLGLAIVKNAVELHGGKIEIDSQVGEGTTVKIAIPLPKTK